MGISASIQVKFAYIYSSKTVLNHLIASGWTYCFEDEVSYLVKENYNPPLDPYDGDEWQYVSASEFNFDEFLGSHKDDDQIGIVLTTVEGIGGTCFIRNQDFYLGISIANVYLLPEHRLIDFNFYLDALKPLFDLVQPESLSCNLSFIG